MSLTTNRSKIIATLGPASYSESGIESLLMAGASIFRLNLSHGDETTHRETIRKIRVVQQKLKRHVAILADLQGPKIRTGLLKDHAPITLTVGQTLQLSCAITEGHDDMIATNSQELIHSLKPGMTVLISDGLIALSVEALINPQSVSCRVTRGGVLGERKGINVPEAIMDLSALTERDKNNAKFCMAEGVDYFALSFVRQATDVEALKAFIQEHTPLLNGRPEPPIIAKIEKPQAVEALDSILGWADVIMVARGDLGVELSPEKVPIVQKQIVDKCNQARKPVIIATQMLETMIQNAQPTRAEVSDVANAVFDGTDVLMLSGETAYGAFPVEAVRMMSAIIHEAECLGSSYRKADKESAYTKFPTAYHAVAHSACFAASRSDIKAIVVLSTSGSMATRLSKLKPNKPIIALTPDEEIANRMCLLWGVTPLVVPFEKTSDSTLAEGERLILERQLLRHGDGILFCAGNTPLPGLTNMLKFSHIGELHHLSS